MGDIINDLAKLSTKFTVYAYVVVDGETYVSEKSKTYSVASMIKEYKGQNITEIQGLYDYLDIKGLI